MTEFGEQHAYSSTTEFPVTSRELKYALML